MKDRRHHNNDGRRQIANGKPAKQVRRIAKQLGLRYGRTRDIVTIVGIVDSNGAVHSRACESGFTTHDDVFPAQTHCRWRWRRGSGLQWLRPSDRPSEEQEDAIDRHLNKKYGIPRPHGHNHRKAEHGSTDAD